MKKYYVLRKSRYRAYNTYLCLIIIIIIIIMWLPCFNGFNGLCPHHHPSTFSQVASSRVIWKTVLFLAAVKEDGHMAASMTMHQTGVVYGCRTLPLPAVYRWAVRNTPATRLTSVAHCRWPMNPGWLKPNARRTALHDACLCLNSAMQSSFYRRHVGYGFGAQERLVTTGFICHDA